MQTKLSGIANKVRFSTEVNGSTNSTSTSQVAVFEMDGQHIELKLHESIIIRDGDSVVVAGRLKRGLFKASAYKNVTANVSGKNHVTLFYILGAIFSLIGTATLFIGLGVIFLATGLALIYWGMQHAEAYKLVMSQL